jgi:hypothetical protein
MVSVASVSREGDRLIETSRTMQEAPVVGVMFERGGPSAAFLTC